MLNKFNKFILIFSFIIGLLLVLILIRNLLPKQIDDVNPLISCDSKYLQESEFLMIIPLYQNVSISNNKTWCNEILSLNKTLAMHGVYHNYKEFSKIQNEDYIRLGMEEFKKCFGFYPKYFEAPQLSLNKKNLLILNNLHIKTHNVFFQIFHKTYHCNENNEYAIRIIGKIYLKNKFIDLF